MFSLQFPYHLDIYLQFGVSNEFFVGSSFTLVVIVGVICPAEIL